MPPNNNVADLGDCDTRIWAAYESAMSRWHQEVSQSRRLGRPKPPQPQFADFVAANDGGDSDVGVRVNGHDKAQAARPDPPANDNLPDGTEAAESHEQIGAHNVVPLPVAKKLNGSRPPEHYEPAVDVGVAPNAIKPIFANIPDELRALPNWLMWRHLPPKRPGQKWRKVPF